MIGRRWLTLLIAAGFAGIATLACGSDPIPAATSPTTIEPATSPPNTPTLTATPTIEVPTAAPVVPTETSLRASDPHFVDSADCQEIDRTPLPLADVMISNGTRWAAFAAEMALTPAEQSQGLMCRESVSGGMLFIWDEERTGGFWMFNTYVPLDIIFFGGRDGNVAFEQMTPCTRGESESDAVWRSRCADESAKYRHGISYTTALELPQGWFESLGFDTEDPAGIHVSFSPRG